MFCYRLSDSHCHCETKRDGQRFVNRGLRWRIYNTYSKWCFKLFVEQRCNYRKHYSKPECHHHLFCHWNKQRMFVLCECDGLCHSGTNTVCERISFRHLFRQFNNIECVGCI